MQKYKKYPIALTNKAKKRKEYCLLTCRTSFFRSFFVIFAEDVRHSVIVKQVYMTLVGNIFAEDVRHSVIVKQVCMTLVGNIFAKLSGIKMNCKSHIFAMLILLSALATKTWAQSPTISPSATYTDANGNEQTETAISESAPLTVNFKANPENNTGWTTHYEWHFYKEGNKNNVYLIRYEENTTFTFTEAGAHYIELWATFTQGNDVIAYTQEYWDGEGQPLMVSISESKLEMPNAFSPNGDGINDIYKAKEGYQSLIEFQATIFNRWGQKLYSWNDPASGWDGKFKGKDVKQGVYFVLVKAKGADGRQFNIKRDVNLLRGYTESTGSGGTP